MDEKELDKSIIACITRKKGIMTSEIIEMVQSKEDVDTWEILERLDHLKAENIIG